MKTTQKRTRRNLGRTASALATGLALSLTVGADAASAASSAQGYSFSITGGSASGSVVFDSRPEHYDNYWVKYTVRDLVRDGLCIRLQRTDDGSWYKTWKTVRTACGVGTSITSTAAVDLWYDDVNGVKLRLCTVYDDNVTGCTSAKHFDNPYN